MDIMRNQSLHTIRSFMTFTRKSTSSSGIGILLFAKGKTVKADVCSYHNSRVLLLGNLTD